MSEWFQIFPEWLVHAIFSTARWVHVLGTALLVGGTLFFEFVVPRAIDDMRMEDQMSTVARLRVAFRQVVWLSAVILPVSGLFSMYRHWPEYIRPDRTAWSAAFYWSMAHMIGGCIVVVISVAIVAGRKVPDRARGWLKVNFVIMLAVMFCASAGRHVRMYARDAQVNVGNKPTTLYPPFRK